MFTTIGNRVKHVIVFDSVSTTDLTDVVAA